MTLHSLLRHTHRWASLTFTGVVIAVFVAQTRPAPPDWIFYLPLAPLALMVPTGLYLFARPYFRRRAP
ncbi:hypothetical protein AADZ90_008320 [Aestuariibius sp. 2305UL40-4]|uniref:hypothetical protein n=1 Tax=Aestuariibius violaceus TaxID=3234132 RepID=UPI00345EE457